MKVKNVVTGWTSRNDRGNEYEYTTLQIVVYNLPNDPIEYSGYVILSRHTGRVTLPIFFVRAPHTAPESLEGVEVSAEIQKQIETAARRTAGTLVPRIQ
jgi:hypothetical protein